MIDQLDLLATGEPAPPGKASAATKKQRYLDQSHRLTAQSARLPAHTLLAPRPGCNCLGCSAARLRATPRRAQK